jgi:hypothetical protein
MNIKTIAVGDNLALFQVGLNLSTLVTINKWVQNTTLLELSK